ncbi:DUF655 domain-containing protein [Halopenitus persicus]|uniref:Putative nucleotide binding protein n=1 Tax=Halopenitus persicus TaxID=1048396 RepID=A0A1H3KP47_9EURY|nr:DUF655 domain-containing protein [Halopenitus persicus]QHS17867.1 DUF655 domain-containing protein [haloarchaeon 3A1-DGR]SDY53394.1 putative nucleotide binding protein [Halopenitus persicus]
MNEPQRSRVLPDGGTEAESGDDTGRSEDGGSAADASADAADEDRRFAVALDVLPQGRPGDDRPQYQKSPIAYALGEADFRLFELTLTDDADRSVGDRIALEPRADDVSRYREVDYDDLTHNAAAEIEYAVEQIVEENERRFVDFYNDAEPITLRLHRLNLLPGIGKKLRNNVLDERKRGPFESFEDIADRISGLHRPKEVLVERIIEEIREDDLKYRVFVDRREE